VDDVRAGVFEHFEIDQHGSHLIEKRGLSLQNIKSCARAFNFSQNNPMSTGRLQCILVGGFASRHSGRIRTYGNSPHGGKHGILYSEEKKRLWRPHQIRSHSSRSWALVLMSKYPCHFSCLTYRDVDYYHPRLSRGSTEGPLQTQTLVGDVWNPRWVLLGSRLVPFPPPAHQLPTKGINLVDDDCNVTSSVDLEWIFCPPRGNAGCPVLDH